MRPQLKYKPLLRHQPPNHVADKDFLELRKAYGQIILGASPTQINGATAYIRHFTPLDQGELDGGYTFFLEKALNSGLSSEEQRLKELADVKCWTEEDEAGIEKQRDYLNGLIETKKLLALPSQIERHGHQIKEAQLLLNFKLSERHQAVGMTAESFAGRKLNEFYIFKSLFKDRELKIPLFSEEEFDYLDISEVNDLVVAFNKSIGLLSDANIKKIALATFFQNSFSLCDDNIYNFYGKPIVGLTFYQSELASYGIFFKRILNAEMKPPVDIINDPDKIIDWQSGSRNREKLVSSTQGSNVAIFNATKEDIKSLASTADAEILAPQVETPKGKTIRGAEFRKLLGQKV